MLISFWSWGRRHCQPVCQHFASAAPLSRRRAGNSPQNTTLDPCHGAHHHTRHTGSTLLCLVECVRLRIRLHGARRFTELPVASLSISWMPCWMSPNIVDVEDNFIQCRRLLQCFRYVNAGDLTIQALSSSGAVLSTSANAYIMTEMHFKNHNNTDITKFEQQNQVITND